MTQIADPNLDLVVRGGTVATAASLGPADIGVRDGKIAVIGSDLPPGEREIDATGRYVIPGGVDVHTHLDARGNGFSTEDDFLSGTIAAACGGTTTIIDFCQQQTGQSIAEALAGWHGKAEGKAVIDYGFHIIVVDLSDRVAAELERLPDEGITSFKLFMAYRGAQMVDDRTMLRVLEIAARSGALVMVHAENGDAADFLIDRHLAAGQTDPVHHALTRPPRIEGEATARAIMLAELAGAPLYIVHVSCRESLNEVVAGRRRGVDVVAETCTHYLYTSLDDLRRPDGPKWVFSPPPRTITDQQELWRALGVGELAVVSSDHGSWGYESQRRNRPNFAQIPNGAVGIEERMTMVYQGVVEGRFGISRFVEMTSTAPARLFGLFPQKGTIAVGSDADLVVWNPTRRRPLRQVDLHHAADYSLYEGIDVQGAADVVIRRGDVLFDGAGFVGTPGSGRFVRRGRFSRATV